MCHNNNWHTVIRIDILWQTSHSEYMSFDHLQMPATTGWISNCVGMTSLGLVGWLVVLRINVDLAIFQPYLDLEAGDNQSLKIQVARRGIEPRSSCSASQELNHSATAAPPLWAVCCIFCFVSSLFHLRICFTFVFVLPTNWPGRGHFCRLIVISFTKPNIFFSRKIFVWHLVRHSGVLIVRQISTALLHTKCTHTVSAILFVFMKINEFSAQGLNFRKMYICILNC